MNLKIKFLLLFILGATQFIYAQNQLTLTKNQMFEDFDSLVNQIKSTSPHIIVKKDLLKYDAIKNMKNLRPQIDTVTSDFSYFLILKKAIFSAQDLHTSFLWYDQNDWFNQQNNKYKELQNRKFKMAIPNNYIDGKYIVREPFKYNDDTIFTGTEITELDGEKIDEYLKKHLWAENFSYDINLHKFYFAGFFKNIETIQKDSLTFTFKTEQSKIKKLTIPTNKWTDYLKVPISKDSSRVELWNKEKILYIRLTEMNPDLIPKLKSEINSFKNRKSEFNKIIIDLRDNPGGRDNAWQNLYAEIIPNSIKYALKLDVTENSPLTNEKIKAMESTPLNPRIKDNNKLLKKYNFYTVIEENEILNPSETSIKFNGKIFVLFENHYSSTGSAMSIPNADENDKIYSVGRKTGEFLGVGFSPMIFELPNTKIKYRIAPSIDVTNIKKKSDLMKDNFDYEIPLTIEELKIRTNYNGNIKSKEYMIQYDSFIKKVIEM